MFYCEKCRTTNNWPDSLNNGPDSVGYSYGPCIICNKTELCHSVYIDPEDVVKAQEEKKKEAVTYYDLMETNHKIGEIDAKIDTLIEKVDTLIKLQKP